MSDSAKVFLDNLNRWALILQLVVIAIPLAIFVYRMDSTMVKVQTDVTEIKQNLVISSQLYSHNHMLYMQGINGLEKEMGSQTDEHRDFRKGQTELTRVMDKLVIVLENLHDKIKPQ